MADDPVKGAGGRMLHDMGARVDDGMAHGDDPDGPLRAIVIVGGGLAGWMAAVQLARALESVSITIVGSAEDQAIGIGEATTPAIRAYLRGLGVGEQEVIAACQGTARLGTEFVDWRGPGRRFFHPFGHYGMRSRGVAFHHYWRKLRAAGQELPIAELCLASAMARYDRFMLPDDRPEQDLLSFDWGMHLDAGLFARFLMRRATAQGVVHVDADVSQVRVEHGLIRAVDTGCGRTITGDLFIDCTGPRARLLGRALETPFEDWTNLLPCDRAVAVPCIRTAPLHPYTRSTARPAGWQWRIPLQHRIGNGHVYSSRHLSDDAAAAALTGWLEGEALAEPRLLRLRAGRRARAWAGNCIALGQAAGFLEPLESTGLALVQSGIEHLLSLLPDRGCAPALADEYNRLTALEYERLRDFLVLHYAANARHGEVFWDERRDTALPPMLAHKLRLFRARGHLVRYEGEIFGDSSWLSLYAGLGVEAASHDPMADHFSVEDVQAAVTRMKASIADTVAQAEPHEAFLARAARD